MNVKIKAALVTAPIIIAVALFVWSWFIPVHGFGVAETTNGELIPLGAGITAHLLALFLVVLLLGLAGTGLYFAVTETYIWALNRFDPERKVPRRRTRKQLLEDVSDLQRRLFLVESDREYHRHQARTWEDLYYTAIARASKSR